jgi:hypothetical protein
MHPDPEDRSDTRLDEPELEDPFLDDGGDERITRTDTLLRALLALVMAVIWGVVEVVLGAIVIFSVLFALNVQEAPPARLRELANRLVAYGYHLWRYMTYNEAQVPFPFSDFPKALEPPTEFGTSDANELRALLAHARDEGHSSR